MEIREVDVHDRAQLAAWFEAEAEAVSHDRPHAVSRTFDALVNQVTEPSEYHESHLLAAYEGERIVGIAELG